MRIALPVIALALAQFCLAQQIDHPSNVAKPKGASQVRVAYYVDPTVLKVGDLLLPPPSTDSNVYREELSELHRIESKRTPQQVLKAQADEEEEDMFIFKTVLGDRFRPDTLPATAALGIHVKNEQSVVGAELKAGFARPRPYQIDPTLHPICKITPQPNSYPSGHAFTGYLGALTLIQLVPEKKDAILARADDYASQRLVCGVHFRSDIEASRKVAYVVFGYMVATPRFQRDLAAARIELRAALGLPAQLAVH